MSIPTRLRGGGPPPLPPRKPSHLSQHSLGLVHGSRQAKYNCSCGPLTKKVECSCATCHSILRDDNSPCSYFGNCVEPLAWNIENELVRTQNTCPLFTSLPKEIREIVFEFALTDDKGQSLESLIKRNVSRLKFKMNQQKPSNDIAVNLLRTCRAIYLETWTLPLSLNPYIIYDLDAPARMGMKLYELLPWQFALIQNLDITLQQTALEGNKLHNYLHRDGTWRPNERHNRVYLAPRRYKTSHGPRAMIKYPESFNFSLIPLSSTSTDAPTTSTTDTSEPRHFLSHLLGQDIYDPSLIPPFHSSMRVMLAAPLTRLTLRLQHSDWWSWTDSPTSPEPLHYLALDPSVGDSRADPLSRPTFPRMRALAEARKAGNHPDPEQGLYADNEHGRSRDKGYKGLGKGWLSTIWQLSDLRSLELVLETFKSKKGQLDEVVEAGKTWVFPLKDTQFELAWDGGVGMSSWSLKGLGKENERGAWHAKEQEFEVRNLRYTRRRIKG